MKSNEYIEKLRRLEWLQSIVQRYNGYVEEIEKAGEDFTVEAVSFSFRGPRTPMVLNSHRPIKAQYIHDALLDAVHGLDIEIAGLESELESVTVELSTTQNE